MLSVILALRRWRLRLRQECQEFKVFFDYILSLRRTGLHETLPLKTKWPQVNQTTTKKGKLGAGVASLHKACNILGSTPSTLNRTKQSKIKRIRNQKGRLRSAAKDGGRQVAEARASVLDTSLSGAC